MEWKKLGYVKASEYRRKILLEIAETPKTPKELSKILNLQLSHVSRTLSELQRHGLVRCLNPESRKGRLFIATMEGKKILKRL